MESSEWVVLLTAILIENQLFIDKKTNAKIYKQPNL